MLLGKIGSGAERRFARVVSREENYNVNGRFVRTRAVWNVIRSSKRKISLLINMQFFTTIDNFSVLLTTFQYFSPIFTSFFHIFSPFFTYFHLSVSAKKKVCITTTVFQENSGNFTFPFHLFSAFFSIFFSKRHHHVHLFSAFFIFFTFPYRRFCTIFHIFSSDF